MFLENSTFKVMIHVNELETELAERQVSRQKRTDRNCWSVALCPSNMLVDFGKGSAFTIVPADALRWKLQIEGSRPEWCISNMVLVEFVGWLLNVPATD